MNESLELLAVQKIDSPHSAIAPHQLSAVEHAIHMGATADQLERLLELQVRAENHKLEMMREKRRMDEEDRKLAALLSFRRDFAAFRGENVIIPKSKFVDRGRAGSFYQADFGVAMTMLSPALSKHGFSLRHDEVFGAKKWTTDGVDNDIPWVYVTCFLEHCQGHRECLSLEGPPGDMSANTPIQNMQVTGSYLKRQSALAITGTATADEDNENKLKRKTDEPTGQDADARAELVQAGNDAAMTGMVALTAWWGKLTAGQQNNLSADFGVMRKAARIADERTGK